jgi:hypothetical protein
MSGYRTIEIDFEVNKLIEVERKSFDDSPNAALRRLLKLKGNESSASEKKTSSQGRAWSEDGVNLPHGTSVRMLYGRSNQLFEGEIVDGRWVVNGRNFDSPSGAASELAVTKRGKKTKLNGWNYWEAKLPDGTNWISINAMRVLRNV